MNRNCSCQKLYEDLDRQISGSILMPGTAIPSENELAEQYSISRPTVRKVLDKFCSRNLLEKRPGKGTFVLQRRSPEELLTEKPFIIGTNRLGAKVVYYDSEFYRGIYASAYGKNVSLNLQAQEELKKGILRKPLDALLLMLDQLPDEVYSSILEQNIPILQLNSIPRNPEIAYLTVDHAAEAEKAVEYLLRFGHREILLLGEESNTVYRAPFLRTLGWKNAYRKMGLPVPENLALSYQDLLVPGKVETFLKENRFTAVFAANWAVYTIFIQEYVRCTGKHDTDLVTLVFDDISLAMKEKALCFNYVRMPLFEMGQAAVEYLRKKKADPDTPIMKSVMPCSLIINQQRGPEI